MGIVNADEAELEEEDEEEPIDDEEFVLCALLRGVNIRVTSSAFIEFSPPWPLVPGFHLERGCRLGGETTAVIGKSPDVWMTATGLF